LRICGEQSCYHAGRILRWTLLTSRGDFAQYAAVEFATARRDARKTVMTSTDRGGESCGCLAADFRRHHSLLFRLSETCPPVWRQVADAFWFAHASISFLPGAVTAHAELPSLDR
jgi:hypothetical protein